MIANTWVFLVLLKEYLHCINFCWNFLLLGYFWGTFVWFILLLFFSKLDIILQFFFSIDFHQIYQWTTSRNQSRSEENLRRAEPGLPGHFQHASVEAHVVWSGLHAHSSAGEEEVRTPGMEHSLRIQCCRLQCQRTVCSEPSGWHGHQKGKIYFS